MGCHLVIKKKFYAGETQLVGEALVGEAVVGEALASTFYMWKDFVCGRGSMWERL